MVGSIPLGGSPEFAVADGLGHIYCNIEDTSEVVKLDSRKLSVMARWSLKSNDPATSGESPTGIALDQAGHTIYAACGNQKMILLDTQSGQIVGAASIGIGPDGAAFDPATGEAFSSNGRDGTLSVVEDGKTRTTVLTRLGARTLALDPKKHCIYLVTATPSGGQGRRRTYVPGSFVLLVVSR